jgi:hypothetical protein
MILIHSFFSTNILHDFWNVCYAFDERLSPFCERSNDRGPHHERSLPYIPRLQRVCQTIPRMIVAVRRTIV